MRAELIHAVHLPVEEMSRFEAGVVDRASRDRIYTHLASCPECRTEAVEVHRILRGHNRARKVPRLLGTAVGLAAMITVVVVLQAPTHSMPAAVTRGVPEARAGVLLLHPLAPLGEISAAAGPLTFIWRPVSEAVEYHLTVTDQVGRTLWTRNTRDTTLLPPLEVALARGFSYFWFVDALLPNGESVTTGTREFRISR